MSRLAIIALAVLAGVLGHLVIGPIFPVRDHQEELAPECKPQAGCKPEPDAEQRHWRTTWRGPNRYLWVDGAWHVWGRDSEWVRLPDGMTPDSVR